MHKHIHKHTYTNSYGSPRRQDEAPRRLSFLAARLGDRPPQDDSRLARGRGCQRGPPPGPYYLCSLLTCLALVCIYIYIYIYIYESLSDPSVKGSAHPDAVFFALSEEKKRRPLGTVRLRSNPETRHGSRLLLLLLLSSSS